MSGPLVLIGICGVAMLALVWKSARSFSSGVRRPGADNNWQNQNYTAAQQGPMSELRPHDTAPAGYPGQNVGGY